MTQESKLAPDMQAVVACNPDNFGNNIRESPSTAAKKVKDGVMAEVGSILKIISGPTVDTPTRNKKGHIWWRVATEVIDRHGRPIEGWTAETEDTLQPDGTTETDRFLLPVASREDCQRGERYPLQPGKYALVKKAGLNFRHGPGMDCDPVFKGRKLYQDDMVLLKTGCVHGRYDMKWWFVQVVNSKPGLKGRTGWVSQGPQGNYLEEAK